MTVTGSCWRSVEGRDRVVVGGPSRSQGGLAETRGCGTQRGPGRPLWLLLTTARERSSGARSVVPSPLRLPYHGHSLVVRFAIDHH